MRRRQFIAALPCAAMAQSAAPAVALNTTAEILFLDLLRGSSPIWRKHRTATPSSSSRRDGDEELSRQVRKKRNRRDTDAARHRSLGRCEAPARCPVIDGKKFDLLDVVGSALANGTNPDHKDYWLPASKDEQDQRQVESSLIAWSLWLLRDTLLPQMSSADRRRLDEWFASCTVVPCPRKQLGLVHGREHRSQDGY